MFFYSKIIFRVFSRFLMTSHCARTFPEDFGLGNFLKAITQVRQESQRAMFQMRKEDPKPKEKEKNVHGRGRPAKYIKPVIENFKRTKAGFKLVQQEVKRLLVDQTKKFPHKAMMDVNEEKVSFTQNGSTNTIKLTELLTKAPHFFPFSIRPFARSSSLDFGFTSG